MKLRFFQIVFGLGILIAAGAAVYAQPASASSSAASMFNGEVLNYEGKVSRYLMSVSVADLTFTAKPANSGGDLLIKTEAVSKGTLLKLFRYSFSQTYESTIDPRFKILRTTKHDVQKERVRDGDANFDYQQNRVTYVEVDPKDPNRPPRRIASEISPSTQDMISAIYYLRTQPLAVNARYELSVSDSGLVYRVPVVVTGKESLKTAIGKVNCFKVEPEVFGPGRLIEQKGKMVIWFTDDPRHTPVKAQIDSQYGKIEIKLRSATK